MKAKYGFQFKTPGKKAMNLEINSQIVAKKDEFMNGIDSVILWTARTDLGFGKKRLKRLYKSIIRNYNEMCKYFQMDDTYPAEYELRKLGIDMDELRKEAFNE